jgi:hypothetical protein
VLRADNRLIAFDAATLLAKTLTSQITALCAPASARITRGSPTKEFTYSHEVLTMITPYQFAASQVLGRENWPHSVEWSIDHVSLAKRRLDSGLAPRNTRQERRYAFKKEDLLYITRDSRCGGKRALRRMTARQSLLGDYLLPFRKARSMTLAPTAPVDKSQICSRHNCLADS